MLSIRFSPITAGPIRPISACGELVKFHLTYKTKIHTFKEKSAKIYADTASCSKIAPKISMSCHFRRHQAGIEQNFILLKAINRETSI